jgi:hypothetical protein
LHDRIDPTVNLLRKNPSTLKYKRVQPREESSTPPIGAPNWCLNKEALERFNRSEYNIPEYDYDTDTSDIDDNDNGNASVGKRKADANRKEKKTSQKKKRKSKEKKHKKKK